MTEKEKRNPQIFKQLSSCRIDLAKRAGIPIVEINKFLKMFETLKKKFQGLDFTNPNLLKMVQENPHKFLEQKTVKVRPGKNPTLFGNLKK